jgi:hypothetical protein
MERDSVDAELQIVESPRHLGFNEGARIGIRLRSEPIRFPIHKVKSVLVLEYEINESFQEAAHWPKLQPINSGWDNTGKVRTMVGEHPCELGRRHCADGEIEFHLLQTCRRGNPRKRKIRSDRFQRDRNRFANHLANNLVKTVNTERAQVAVNNFRHVLQVAEVDLLQYLVEAGARPCSARKGKDTGGRRFNFRFGFIVG